MAQVGNRTYDEQMKYADSLASWWTKKDSENVMSYTVPVAIGLLVLIGAIGNGALLYVVCKHKRMKNVPNAFLTNVAVADALLLFAVAPFLIFAHVVGDWSFGSAVCKMTEGIQTFALAMSAFNVIALSIERYSAFATPPRRRRYARKRACVGICILWILAAIAALPDALSALVDHTNDTPTVRRCIPFTGAWGSTYPKIHTVVSMCVFFAVPLCLVLIFYMSLGCVVCGKKRREKRTLRGCYHLNRQLTNGYASGDPLIKQGSAILMNGGLTASPLGNHGTPQGNGNGAAKRDGVAAMRDNGGTGKKESSGGTLRKENSAATLKKENGGSTLKKDHNCGTLRKDGGRSYGENEAAIRESGTSLSRKVKKRKTMAKVATVLCFQISILWGPKYAYRAWLYFFSYDSHLDIDIWSYVKLAGMAGGFLNAALVPFTVIAFNKGFRHYLSKYLCCCCSCAACCCIDDVHNSSSRHSHSSSSACRSCCWSDEGDIGPDDCRAEGCESCDRQPSEHYRQVPYDYYQGQRTLSMPPDRRFNSEYSEGGRDVTLYDAGMLTDRAHLRRPYDAQYAEPVLMRLNPGAPARYSQMLEQPAYNERVRNPTQQEERFDSNYNASQCSGAFGHLPPPPPPPPPTERLQSAYNTSHTSNDYSHLPPAPPPPMAFDSGGSIAAAPEQTGPGVYI